jgi:hypothetical protein
MEWILSSLAVVTAALVCAVLLLVRRQRVMAAQQYALLCRLSELQSTVGAQQRQLESLKAALSAAPQTNGASQPVHDQLALIEQLSDAAALHDDQSLKNAADKICVLPAGVAADLFEVDRKLLAISRLLNQGNSFSEIAARLNLPLGEVELLANTRS